LPIPPGRGAPLREELTPVIGMLRLTASALH
jgi:hypothetical protein